MMMIIRFKDGTIFQIDMEKTTKGAFDDFCSKYDFDVIDYRVKVVK